MDINLLSKEEQIKIIHNNNEKIKDIKDPCLEVQLAAVNENGYSIKYIENPCLEVQLAAVNEDGHNINYINNPCYEVQLVAIQEETNIYKMNFEFIKQYITYPDLLELLELKILTCYG